MSDVTENNLVDTASKSHIHKLTQYAFPSLENDMMI